MPMAQEPKKLNPAEVEKLLQSRSPLAASGASPQVDPAAAKSNTSAATAEAAPTATEPLPPSRKKTENPLPAGDVEFLLKQAEEAIASVDAPRAEEVPGLAP